MKILAIQRGQSKDRHKYLVDLEHKSRGQILDVRRGIAWPPMSIHALLMRGYWEPFEHDVELLSEIPASMTQRKNSKEDRRSERRKLMAKPINELTEKERQELFYKDGFYDWDAAGEYAVENPPTYTKNIDHGALFRKARAEGLAEGKKERGEEEE